MATWHRPTIDKWFDSFTNEDTMSIVSTFKDPREKNLLHDVFPKHIADQLKEGRKASRNS
eukprot:5943955-Pyramimonas_sp.AAC.2